MISYKVFKYGFGLGEQTVQHDDVLCRVMIADFERKQRLQFKDPSGNRTFVHEYLWMDRDVPLVTVFKLGYVLKKTDFPHCVVVVSLKEDNPYIVIANYETAFESADEVAEILGDALNSSLATYGLSVSLSPCSEFDMDAEDWVEYMYKVYKTAKKHKLETQKALGSYRRKDDKANLKACFIFEDKADDIVNLIHLFAKGKTEAKDIMRPFKAAMDAGVLRRLSYNEFGCFFDCVKVNRSSYYKYAKPDMKPYEFDDLFIRMKHQFDAVMTR